MDRFRPVAVLVLAVWSAAIWIGRLDLAWSLNGSTGSKLVATVPVVIFVALGVALGLLVLTRPGAALSAAGRPFAVVVAVWTIGYWVVRLPFIVTDSHGAAFHAVHAVLAVLSWTVAAFALRAVLRARRVRPGNTAAPARAQPVAG